MIQQPIKWHGGKRYIAKHVLALAAKFPHLTYSEVFFGGGSVLLQKRFEGISEVVNDLNGQLTNFWRVLQDEDDFTRFKRIVEATPFSQVEFEVSENAKQTTDAVENAVNFFITARQCRQGLMKDFATLTVNRIRRGMNEQVSAWLTAVDGLPDVHARLKRVLILNEAATAAIKRCDAPTTLHYCDPPYVHETRTATDAYEFEMTAAQHGELLCLLTTIKGKFILSGYPSELYGSFERKHGWHRTDIVIDNKSSSAKTKEKKTECLWYNFDP